MKKVILKTGLECVENRKENGVVSIIVRKRESLLKKIYYKIRFSLFEPKILQFNLYN